MFRTFEWFIARRFAVTGVAITLFSFAVVGCSSSNDTTTPPVDASTSCDLAGVQAVISAKLCATSGCHDSAGSAAGLDLTSTATASLASRLVGVSPKGVNGSFCGSQGPYLVAGSNPATGLLLDKISGTVPCGSPMPLGGSALTPTQKACFQTWANSVTVP